MAFDKDDKNNISFIHYSVMTNEIVGSLNCDNSDKIFVDCTLGAGGHSEQILKRISPNGRLISFDVDDDAIKFASNRLKDYKNLTVIKGSYIDIDKHLAALGINKITGGVIFDLGASYHQLTKKERGFSFSKESKLDMRFNQDQDFSAWDIVNKYSESDLVEIFSKYGEERFSKRIARAIVDNRSHQPINTTKELSDLIIQSTPKNNSKIHPATRVFQALRIEVNSELLNFENTLLKVIHLVEVDAIISVLTFHSLEDRIAKHTLKKFLGNKTANKYKPNEDINNNEIRLELINKKPIMATEAEIMENLPSRSAKLRIAKRV